MHIKELDVVSLIDGRTATILEVYDAGKSLLIEASFKPDEDGEVLEVSADKIRKILYRS